MVAMTNASAISVQPKEKRRILVRFVESTVIKNINADSGINGALSSSTTKTSFCNNHTSRSQ